MQQPSTDTESAPDAAATGEPVLHVPDLRKTYGSGEDAVTAVDDVSFNVERGGVVGVPEPNGAGKTTTSKSIPGLVIPTAGSVEIAGVDTTSTHERSPGTSARCSRTPGTSTGSPPSARTCPTPDSSRFENDTSIDGTGLSLSIVRTVADAHAWRVETPEDADGSRFEFTIL